MQVADIRFLFEYHYWAIERMLAAADQLSTDQLLARDSGSGTSIRDTLVHALSVEEAWLSGWQGNQHMPNLEPADFPTVETLRTFWKSEETKMHAYLNQLTDEDLHKPFYIFPLLWQVMAHVAYHGMQHRSEAALLMTQQGVSPGAVDLMNFIRPDALAEHSRRSEA